jgi:hypothetical protein
MILDAVYAGIEVTLAERAACTGGITNSGRHNE